LRFKRAITLLFCLLIKSGTLLAEEEYSFHPVVSCQEAAFPGLELTGQDDLLGLADEMFSQSCLEHERGFATFITRYLENFVSDFDEGISCENENPNSQCSESFETIMIEVMAYRAAIDGQYRGLFSNWYDNSSTEEQEIIRNCFSQEFPPESIDSLSIRFGNHHTELITRDGIAPTLCVAPLAQWQSEIREGLPLLRENPSQYGISGLETFVTESFERGRLRYMIEDASWSSPNTTESAVRSNIYRDIKQVPERVNAMREQISNFSDGQLEHLYLFNNLYQQVYLPSLSLNISPEQFDTIYPSCLERNGSGICFRVLTARTGDSHEVNRCVSRIKDLGLDMFLPGHMLVSAQLDTNFAREALVAGLISYEEYFDESTANSTEMLWGLPIGGMVSTALPRVTTGIGSGISRASQRTLSNFVEGSVDEISDQSRRAFLRNSGAALATTAIVPTTLGRFLARSADDVVEGSSNGLRRTIMRRFQSDMQTQVALRRNLNDYQQGMFARLNTRFLEQRQLITQGNLEAARTLRQQDSAIIAQFRQVLTRYLDDTERALGRQTPERFSELIRRGPDGQGFARPYSNLINSPQSIARGSGDDLMFVNRETRDTAQRMLDWLDIYQSH